MKRTWVVTGILFLAAAIVITAAARKTSAPGGWEQSKFADQLKFSHKFHVGEAGIACEDCHKASASKKASDNLRANHDNCQTCHEEQLNNKCDFCHKNPENIEALPLPQRTIVFAHETHLKVKGVECATCHKGLDSTDYAGPKNMPSMETCTSCHNDARATRTCVTCHTSFTNLIPPDHLVPNFQREHRKLTRLGSLDVGCATCHDQTFCADCHAGAGLIGVGVNDLMSDPAPRLSTTETPKQMQLQMVHDLNYRYTHAIDARSKAKECYTCHSAQSFCTECHMAGGNITQPDFKPASHAVPGFALFGRGSGGGDHAVLARRDIESCVSCHDVRGADPTCITCHIDADGIKGTDPRTHPNGYQEGSGDGSWHTNQGATCYSCHTDYNAHPGGKRGVGFCGYCHK
jgi:Cytochrome c7 and related cytochrome c